MFRDIDFLRLIVKLDIDNSEVHLETGNKKYIGSFEWMINKEKKDMYISNFNIAPKYRNKGYGNFLARVMIDLARLYHLKTVTLIDGSNLKGFWQRLGFKDKKRAEVSVLKL